MSKAKKIIICFLGACLFAFSGLTAFAADSIYINTVKPEITEKVSYMEAYMTKADTTDWSSLWGWTFVTDVETELIITFTGTRFIVTAVDDSNVYVYRSDLRWNSFEFYGSGSSIALEWDRSSFDVLYCRTYGNIRNQTGLRTGDYNVVYGDDRAICDKLDIVISMLENQNSNSDRIISNATDNANNIQANNDKNANNIQSNNDKNTQSIIDNQNQLAEQEKTETENSGNDSVNDVSGSVPDKSAGMLSALQSLSNAVSYTGTSAKWTFPQMYIPSIAGVTDRINLNPEMEIDFTYWVNQIPEDIMTLISALATIGLVVFAFKELYGLISYVLTLKGGGNNE